MCLIRKFKQILPRLSLLNICKTFIRTRLDYANIIYDQAYNSASHNKRESIQCNICLAITGAVRRTSTEKAIRKAGFRISKMEGMVQKALSFL